MRFPLEVSAGRVRVRLVALLSGFALVRRLKRAVVTRVRVPLVAVKAVVYPLLLFDINFLLGS